MNAALSHDNPGISVHPLLGTRTPDDPMFVLQQAYATRFMARLLTTQRNGTGSVKPIVLGLALAPSFRQGGDLRDKMDAVLTEAISAFNQLDAPAVM
jgi:hypothetical protein